MFSVIIPVHNSEKTLRKCLDSLLQQNYGKFEVLLVENGSTDMSYAICNEYAKKDKRFKVYDIGNCNGPSKPRNYGLDKATGDYIAFLDSDDWFAPGVLEMLNCCFLEKKADVVFFGFCMVKTEDVEQSVCFPVVTAEDKKAKCIQLQEQDCFGYTCCKAFSRGLLCNTRFDETLQLLEDELLALEAMKRAETVAVVSEKYHHYYYYYYYHVNDTENSLMKKTHGDIVCIKDKEYKAWKSFLDGEYADWLSVMANRAVNYCRFYIFEHHLALKKSYQDLVNTVFYQDALQNPKKRTKQISKGYFRFRMDWLIWKVKTTLR